MNWGDALTEERSILLRQIERFLKDAVAPNWFEIERREEFPRTIVAELAALGLFGLTIPERYGGSGADAYTGALAARLISYHWPALYLIVTANSSLAAHPLLCAGTEKQKERYLPLLARGEALGCFALTEPNAGSDVAGIKTRAVREKAGWSISGSKLFITNAANAHLAIVFARTGKRPHDISAFIVASEKPLREHQHLKIRKQEKWSQKGSDMCEMFFDGVFVPDDALLGEKNNGFKTAMETLERGRLNIAAQALGATAWILDYVWEYLQKRSAFGGPIARNQYPLFQFSGWYAELRTLWNAVKDTAQKIDEGTQTREEAAGVKLIVTERAWRIAVPAAQYMGGMFFDRSCPVMGRLMDVLITPVYEGASNIQRMVIAKNMPSALS